MLHEISLVKWLMGSDLPLCDWQQTVPVTDVFVSHIIHAVFHHIFPVQLSMHAFILPSLDWIWLVKFTQFSKKKIVAMFLCLNSLCVIWVFKNSLVSISNCKAILHSVPCLLSLQLSDSIIVLNICLKDNFLR